MVFLLSQAAAGAQTIRPQDGEGVNDHGAGVPCA